MKYFILIITILSCVTFEMAPRVSAVTLAPDNTQSNTFLHKRQSPLLNKRNRIQESETKTNDEGIYKYKFVNQSFGVLTSPLYPTPYPSNISSYWEISMAEGQRIVIMIRQFMLEPGDELSITNDQFDEVYTSKHSPDELMFLPTNKVDITLTSSSFLLNTATDIGDVGDIPKQRLFYAMFEREGCGGILNRSYGYINVPIYIHGLKRPHECVWTIKTTQDKVVSLEFLEFDLQPGSCIYNNIYVRDGDWSGGYMLGQFCEENPPFSKLRTVTNTMTITYRVRPNLYENRRQYDQLPYIKMFYRVVDNCGGDLEGYSGTFEAPVGWHNGKSTCRWKIRVPESKIILLKIKEWKLDAPQRDYSTFKEHVQVTTKDDSIIWDSSNVDTVPESLLISSNQGVVSLSAPSIVAGPYIHFKMYYEAVSPLDTGKCFSIADKDFFMCRDETYIDCQKRCDGVSQCETGSDEADCPTIGVRRSFGHSKPQKEPIIESDDGGDDETDLNTKPRVSQRYALLWLAVMIVSATGIGSVVLLDQLLKRKPGNMNQSPITNLQHPPPPPYKEFEDDDDTTAEQSGYSYTPQPPSYRPGVSYSGCEEGTFSSLEERNNSEFISRTFSTPSIIHETSSSSSYDGSSEMLNRPRHHSTPFGAPPFYSSTSTLGSSESITRGVGLHNFRGSTDGSTESITIPRRNCSQQIAALFHDTDVIESTSTMTITTPVQGFRFSDSSESNEEFMQQIRDFREPEV